MLVKESLHHAAHKIDLILIDRVAHVWIQARSDLPTQTIHHFCGPLNVLFWHVEVYVTASQEDRRPGPTEPG